MRTRLGAAAWLLATPLFLLVQLVVGLAWREPRFSWTWHNISDLGNVTCGVWDTTRPRAVCSPWHTAMNGAMVVTGLLLVAGVVLTWSALGRGVAARAGQAGVAAAGAGWVLAGVFPADVDENLHLLGALLIFVVGNLGVLIAALTRRSPVLRRIRVASAGLGVVGSAGLVLFVAQAGVGLGVGGMERVTAFAGLGWTMIAALAVVRSPSAAIPGRGAHGQRQGRPEPQGRLSPARG